MTREVIKPDDHDPEHLSSEWNDSLLDRIDELERTIAASGSENAKLRAELEAARYAATHDELTGLLNRRGYNEAVEELIAEYAGKFALIIGDLDDLKLVNKQAPSAGDELIRKAGITIMHNIRGSRGDIAAARHGGDEFAVLLRVDDEEVLADIIKRLEGTLTANGVNMSIDGHVHTEGQTGEELFDNVSSGMVTKKEVRKNEKRQARSWAKQALRWVGKTALNAAGENTTRL